MVVKDARSDRLAHQLEFKGAEHKSATFAPDYPRAFGTSSARAGKGLAGGWPGAGAEGLLGQSVCALVSD